MMRIIRQSFPIMLIPIRDYFLSRRKIYKIFLWPGVCGFITFLLISYIPVKDSIKVNDVFLNFINVQISGIAILISFTIAVITILVTSGNKNVEYLKERPADKRLYKEIKVRRNSQEKETITLFQVLLSGITYNVLSETIFLVLLFFELFLQATISSQIMKYVIAIDAFLLIHILYVLCQTVVNIYFVFWKRLLK